MNSRQRFLETMSYEARARPPLFEEGIRDGVIESWQQQGLPAGTDLGRLFQYDRREEIELDLDHRLNLAKLPRSRRGLAQLKRSLDADDSRRLPSGWEERVRLWKQRTHALMLPLHEGFFLTLGIGNWRSFSEMIYIVTDEPRFVREVMEIQGDFAAGLAERVLREVQVEAAIFGEPIASIHGPLISPRMYEEIVLASYRPALQVLRRYGVQTTILRTYANARALVPAIVNAGFNCLWANERDAQAMDYLDLRREFGRDLRLIGGLDLDALRQEKETIRGEMERVVPPLLAQGGYIPLADGRVREDVPYENYVYYRRLLEEVVRG